MMMPIVNTRKFFQALASAKLPHGPAIRFNRCNPIAGCCGLPNRGWLSLAMGQ